jgi:BioD-like phosphotransacetylase family protein
MSLLFIGSTGDQAGHSLITWAIARRLTKMGLKVGFVKPFGTDPIYIDEQWIDHDAHLLKQSLQLREPLGTLCPFLVSDETWRTKGTDEIMAGLKSLVQELSESKDLVIIMGSKHIFFDDVSCPVPDISFISELNADILLIHRYRKISRTIYSLLSVSSLAKNKMRGIILNRIPPEEIRQINSSLIPNLREKGIPVISALPEDPFLSFRSLREVREIVSGEILWGGEHLEKPVGAMTVGSADLSGELLIFRRVYNKIVFLEASVGESKTEISPGPRPVAGILLTGGRQPPFRLVETAEKRHLPLLLTNEDTFTALEKLEKSTSHLSPADEAKVRRATELIDHDGGFDRLVASLGLS